MMMNEFTERTGIDPTAEEYSMIEEMYYEFDGDKNAFCKDFVKKNRMLEVQREIIAAVREKVEELRKEQLVTDKELHAAQSKIACLEAQLEREQEWKPYEDTQNCTDEKYGALARTDAEELSDEEAVKMIADEFGFEAERIHIIRWAPVYEINRHHRLRQVGQKDRSPRFAAWDWNYIRFNVIANVARAYEMVDGELKLYCD